MKSFLYLVTFIYILFCCTSRKSDSKAIDLDETVSLGDAKDKHGCLVAAGQSWSQLRKDCVQIFEIGIRLDPVDINLGDAVISSFVLMSNDSSELELFLPDIEESILLPKSAKGTYQNNIYRYDPLKHLLYINEELTYEAAK